MFWSWQVQGRGGQDRAGGRAGVGAILPLPVLVQPGTPGHHLAESQLPQCLPGEVGIPCPNASLLLHCHL